MRIYSILNKTKNGMLMRIETARRGGFPRFEIYYKNPFFNAREIEAKIKSAALAKRLKYPKGVTVTLITPQASVSDYSNMELAIALSSLYSSRSERSVMIASSMSAVGECAFSDIIPSSLIRMCESNSIEDVILSESARALMEREVARTADSELPRIRVHYAKSLIDAWRILEKLERKEPEAEIERKWAYISLEKRAEEDKVQDDPFRPVIGLDACKEALAVALAGRHNLLILGSKGSGKSLLLDAVAKIRLPVPERIGYEQEENAMILRSADAGSVASYASDETHSFVNLSGEDVKNAFKSKRDCVPTAIAWHGKALLADDAHSFGKASLTLLKGLVTRKSLVFRNESYPLDAFLIATARFCKCGNANSMRMCECSASSIGAFKKILKESIMDCFDMTCEISEQVIGGSNGKRVNTGDTMLSQIKTAVAMQQERYAKDDFISFNSDILKAPMCEAKSKAIAESGKLFGTSFSIDQALKAYCIARTLADMAGREAVSDEDASMSIILAGGDRLSR